jgi:hypothetical protein
MGTPNDRASAILREFEQAQDELVGKAVILTDGKAGRPKCIAQPGGARELLSLMLATFTPRSVISLGLSTSRDAAT